MSRLGPHLDVRIYLRISEDIHALGHDPAKAEQDIQALGKLYQYVHSLKDQLSARQSHALKKSIRHGLKRCQKALS